MNLIPRSSLFDFDSLFDDFWAPTHSSETAASSFSPRVDIKEKKGKYEIAAELPGIDKKDIDVTLDNGILSISAESEQEDKEEKDGRVIRQERRYGRFVRSFNLGGNVKEADIKAEFKDGVLKLTVPKAQEQEQVSKRIEIH